MPNAAKTMSTGMAFAILMIGILALSYSAIMVKDANFEPATSAFLRCAIAFVVLIPFAFFEIKKKGFLDRRGFYLAGLAGIFLGIDMVAWNYAIFYVGAGISSVLLNLQIIILPALAMIFDRFKPDKSFWLLVPLMIIGIVLTGGILDAAPNEGPATIYGVPLAILGTMLGSTSGFCYGIYLYTSRKSGTLNPGRYVQPLAVVFVAQLIPQLIVMFLISGRGFDIVHGVLINGHLSAHPETMLGDPITTMNWIWIVALAIVGHALAWVFVQIGSVNMHPTTVAGLLLLSPILTVIVAGFTHGEKASMLQIIGIIIVLAAVAFQNKLHIALMDRLRTEKREEDEAAAPEPPG
jgi:drug/metabolite transporter (DMT)-like permease